MTRFKAAGIHLALSALIVAIVLGIMWFVWYPKGFFKLLGGSEVLFILAAVDICLGPLLTLVVFNVAKKSLKMDLTIIGVIQIAALIYGASVMFKSRPVFNVLEIDLFKVTLASEFKDDTELKLAKKEKWRSLPLLGPKLVAALSPTDPDLRNEMVFAAAEGRDWNVFPKLFVEYDTQKSAVLKKAKPINGLIYVDKANELKLNDFIGKHGGDGKDYVYLPIVAGPVVMTAILDAETAAFIEIVDIIPPYN